MFICVSKGLFCFSTSTTGSWLCHPCPPSSARLYHCLPARVPGHSCQLHKVVPATGPAPAVHQCDSPLHLSESVFARGQGCVNHGSGHSPSKRPLCGRSHRSMSVLAHGCFDLFDPHAPLCMCLLQLWFLQVFQPLSDPLNKPLTVSRRAFSSLTWWTIPAHLFGEVHFQVPPLSVKLMTNASLWG